METAAPHKDGDDAPDTYLALSNSIQKMTSIIDEYADHLKPFMPDIAAARADQSGVTADAIHTAYSLYTDPNRFSHKYFSEHYITQYKGYENPMLWRLFAIWAYIITSVCQMENDAEYQDTLYTCAEEARHYGDTIVSPYIKAHAMYNMFYEFTGEEMVEIFATIESGIQAEYTPALLLKAQIYCNEEMYDDALPYLLTLTEKRSRQGVRMFIREYIHNEDRAPHYRFLAELKNRARDRRLLEYLAAPPADVVQFLKSRKVDRGDGVGDGGATAPAPDTTCPICFEDREDLIYHDCRERSHAVCIPCYCKTADRCPTCRFDLCDTKNRLVNCLY